MPVFNPNVAQRHDVTTFTAPISSDSTWPTRGAYKKNRTTEAVVNPRRIVKYGAAADTILQGAAATDLTLGVTTNTVASGVGSELDVVMFGETLVTSGAAFARGALLTSDGTGRAVTAAATNRAVGIALTEATAADQSVLMLVSICTA
jgi:hypothetical protein